MSPLLWSICWLLLMNLIAIASVCYQLLVCSLLNIYMCIYAHIYIHLYKHICLYIYANKYYKLYTFSERILCTSVWVGIFPSSILSIQSLTWYMTTDRYCIPGHIPLGGFVSWFWDSHYQQMVLLGCKVLKNKTWEQGFSDLSMHWNCLKVIKYALKSPWYNIDSWVIPLKILIQ